MSDFWLRVFLFGIGFVSGFGLLAFARNGYVERLEQRLSELRNER